MRNSLNFRPPADQLQSRASQPSVDLEENNNKSDDARRAATEAALKRSSRDSRAAAPDRRRAPVPSTLRILPVTITVSTIGAVHQGPDRAAHLIERHDLNPRHRDEIERVARHDGAKLAASRSTDGRRTTAQGRAKPYGVDLTDADRSLSEPGAIPKPIVVR